MNQPWTDAELDFIDQAVLREVTVEQVLAELPHRSVKAIRKKMLMAMWDDDERRDRLSATLSCAAHLKLMRAVFGDRLSALT